MDKSVKRLPVLLCVMLAAAVGLGALAVDVYQGMDLYVTPFTEQLPEGPGSQPVTDTVIMFVIDGLRADFAPEMLSYRILATSGSSAVAVCAVPSLSQPAAAALGTGADHEVHGITTNQTPGEVKVDSLFASAQREGIGTTVISGGGWDRLFGSFIDRSIVVNGKDGFTDVVAATRAMDVLAGSPTGLIIIHFDQVDAAGHEYGAYHYQYRAAMIDVDYMILDMLPLIDFEQVTVIFVSDHGHVNHGGHGGSEPVVINTPLAMAGRGIKRAGHDPVRHIDIAPTIAALLGLPAPAHAAGRIVTEFITEELDPAAVRNSLTAASLFTQMYGDVLGADTSQAAINGNLSISSPDEYRQAMGDLESRRERFRSSYVHARRIVRVVPGLLVIAVALLVAGPGLTRYRWWTVVVILSYHLLYLGMFWARGLVFSPSWFNSYEQATSFFVWRGIEAVILTMIIVGIILRRMPARSRVDGAVAAVDGACLIMLSLAIQATTYYVMEGLEFYAVMPDVNWGVKFFVDLVQMIAVGIAAPLAAAAGAVMASARKDSAAGV